MMISKEKLIKFFQKDEVQQYVNFGNWEEFWWAACKYFYIDELQYVKKLFDNQNIQYTSLMSVFKFFVPSPDMQYNFIYDDKDIPYHVNNVLKLNELNYFKYKLNITSPGYIAEFLRKLNLKEYNSYNYSTRNDVKLEILEILLSYNEKEKAIKMSFWGNAKEVTGFYFGHDLIGDEEAFIAIPGIGIAYSIEGIEAIIQNDVRNLENLGVII